MWENYIYLISLTDFVISLSWALSILILEDPWIYYGPPACWWPERRPISPTGPVGSALENCGSLLKNKIINK